MSKTVLEFEDITKEYRQGRGCVEVLKACNYKAEEGTINAIIGPSGSGKSTFLQIAGLLDKPTSGNLYFAGAKLNIHSAVAAAKFRLQNIGFVYQYHHLLRDFSALENVLMPLWIAGKIGQEEQQHAEELLIELGLENRLYNFPEQLSGGEQQRVAIARAIVHKPKLILADEPTGNLDPEASEQVFSLMLDLVRKHGITAVIVTHNHLLAKKADTIYQLPEGSFKSS